MLCASVEAMGADEKIWKTYFTDFVAYKLKLGPENHTLQGNIAQQILYENLEDVHRHEMPLRLVLLHCSASVNHLDLAQLAAVLRPLSEIGMVREIHCMLVYNYNFVHLVSFGSTTSLSFVGFSEAE